MVIQVGELVPSDETNIYDSHLLIDHQRLFLFGEYEAQIKMCMDIEMQAEHFFLSIAFLSCQ